LNLSTQKFLWIYGWWKRCRKNK